MSLIISDVKRNLEIVALGGGDGTGFIQIKDFAFRVVPKELRKPSPSHDRFEKLLGILRRQPDRQLLHHHILGQPMLRRFFEYFHHVAESPQLAKLLVEKGLAAVDVELQIPAPDLREPD